MKSMLPRWIGVFLLFVGLFGGMVGPALAAPPPPDEVVSGTGSQPVVVWIGFKDRADLNRLAGELDVWEVRSEQHMLKVALRPEQIAGLIRTGHTVKVDVEASRSYNQPHLTLPGQVSGIPGYTCYRTVEETFAAGDAIVAAHPDMAHWVDIGDSWLKTQNQGGYDLKVLVLTNQAIPGPKPILFLMSGVHAREYAPPELTLRFAESLISRYGIDPDVTWMLDYQEVQMLFMSNPDGRKQAETGLSWRKNYNNTYCANTTSRGADLNRNYSFSWNACGGSGGCSSGTACADTYRGPSPASEPETQAVETYVRSIFVDTRGPGITATAALTTSGIFFDLHSYSRLVLWPWGATTNVAPNGVGMQTLGRKVAYFSDYTPQQSVDLYATDGSTDDFAYGELGLPAYTIEMGDDFFEPCSSFESELVPDNLKSLEYTLRVVRAPYLLPSGPDSVSPSVQPSSMAPGTVVSLSVSLDDTRFAQNNGTEPTQAIVGGEYSIDVPFWVTTTTPITYALAPQDGQFNTTVEPAVAQINTTGLAVGRHTIYIHAQDASGAWGPVSAIFFYVVDPVVSPRLSGYVRSAGENLPLAATVKAGAFQVATDPATGFYSMYVTSGTFTVQAEAVGHSSLVKSGIVAQNSQTTTVDFALEPYCSAFADNGENGNGNWTINAPWALTTEAAHSATHSWTDSPGGAYGNNLNIALTSPALDLSQYSAVALQFWQTYAFESGYDFGYVEYQINGGTWQQAVSYTGSNTSWNQVQVPLSALNGQSNVKIRFHITSDTGLTADGWHIDDLNLVGTGSACHQPLAPTAEFSVPAKLQSGQGITFTSLVTGSQPISYFWDFGDGIGTSVLPNPVYTYSLTGTFTVTLNVTNTIGSYTSTRALNILPPPEQHYFYLPLIFRER